mmetsp:Transcript_84218/g.181614  ORF Transcript_84218/g.181614 Transcript_84218/m.181614 type:complete len:83 (-) Transcript_84218:904-1152(-)
MLRAIIPMVFQKILANPFAISGIDVPCDPCEGISLMHRMINFFSAAPFYMNQGLRDVHLRMHFISAMLIAGFRYNLSIRRGF